MGEHNPEEFYANVIQTVKETVEKAGVLKEDIVGVGISNQRETALAGREMGVLYIMPLYGNVPEVRKSVRKLRIKRQ